jgi:hypothetical protein
MKSRPQTLKGTNLVNVHIKMPKEVAMIFLKTTIRFRRRRITTTRTMKTSKTSKIFCVATLNSG